MAERKNFVQLQNRDESCAERRAAALAAPRWRARRQPPLAWRLAALQ